MVGFVVGTSRRFIGGWTRIAGEVSRQFGNFVFGSRLVRHIAGDDFTGFGSSRVIDSEAPVP